MNINKIKKLLVLLLSRQYIRGVFYGVAAAIEHEKVLKLLTIATVVDVGANKGQFSLVARKVFKDARIVAFEPIPHALGIIRSVFNNDDKLTIFPYALGDISQDMTMHISEREDSSSLLPITQLQNRVFPGTAEQSTFLVKSVKTQEAIAEMEIVEPALLKIDVQGYELQVLRGADQSINKFAYIYVECSFLELYENQALAADVIHYLYARGFKVQGVYNLTYDHAGRAVQADFLFNRINL